MYAADTEGSRTDNNPSPYRTYILGEEDKQKMLSH